MLFFYKCVYSVFINVQHGDINRKDTTKIIYIYTVTVDEMYGL